MSIELMTKVWKTDVGPATKRLVLLALADGASDDGALWPFVSTIARKVGVSVSTARTWISRLESEGIVERVYRVDQSNIYKINVDAIDSLVDAVDKGHKAPSKTPDVQVDSDHEPPTNPTGSPVDPHRQPGGPPPGPRGTPHRQPGGDPTDSPVPEPSLNPQGTVRGGAPASASKAKRPRGRTQLPEDWQPMDKHRTYAAEHGLDLEREAFRFRNHAVANGRVQANWNAAFTTWLDKARDFRPKAAAAAAEGRKVPWWEV